MSTGPDRVVEAAEAFLSVVSSFDAVSATVPDCARLADVAARVEKAASGLRVLASSRAVDGGAHREAGVADPAVWVARQGGSTRREAKGALELGRSLDSHPDLRDAVLQGDVSVAQATEIAKFEAECPGHEQRLVEVAKAGDLTKLRDETRQLRLSHTPVRDLHRAQLAARSFRHWLDGLGMVRFDGALPPETGIPFVTRIERDAARRYKAAKRDGRVERFEAHAADALVGLCDSGAGGSGGRWATDLVVVCDLNSWRRGHAHPGEPCHIVGGGPIPVEVAKELAQDAFLKCVLHDGVEIHTVSHHGRHLKAELRTALDLGPVPEFTGQTCVDCGGRDGLEYDHQDPYANHGPTSYGNLKARCWLCHQLKTQRDLAAGRLGPKTKWMGRGTAKSPATARTTAAAAATAAASEGPPRSPGREERPREARRELLRPGDLRQDDLQQGDRRGKQKAVNQDKPAGSGPPGRDPP